MSTIRVDRITPYQSGSVAIEGLSLSNLTIDGTITASIQEGYVLVGGSGNVSTLAPTSSFGGGGGADITSLNSFTASQQALNTTFADTGSNSFIGNQTVSGSVTVVGQNRVTAVNPGVVLIHSGSSTITLAPNSLTLIHSESANNNIIGFSASPIHAGLANVNEPSIFTADSSSNYYQAIEFQSQGRFAQNKVSFKVPVDVSGSMNISGSTNQVGNIILTGSLTISGSSTFRNIGPTILSGSVDISGSINSDGYELVASSTETIPALNSTFNLDLSGSASTFIKKTLVLNDGKVLIVGRFESVNGHPTNHIARLNSNGTVDTSFTAPTIGASFDPGNRYINNLALQSNGKIIIVGNFYTVGVTGRHGVARLNTNGTEDFTFDASNGLIDVGLIRDVVVQSDDKIIVVGQIEGGIKRMNSDGSADSSLNVAIGFSDNSFYSVALLDSGSEQAILVGGDFQQWDTYSDYHHLVKLNPSGSLDFGFAGTNLDIATGDSLDRIQKIKVTDAYSPGDNGYIYIAGRFKDTRTGPNVRNAGFGRVTTEDEGFGRGAFDSGFRTYISGSDQNLPGVSVYVNDFDFYDSDKILLGGNFITFGIPGYSTTSANRFAIVNQNTGNLISDWATSGSAATYRLNTGSVDSVTLLPNDNVLVGGTFTSASNPLTAREGLASLKLTGFGQVTNTADYSITADTNQLLISSSNTYFSGDITASVISGSFVGDGSGLTNLVLPSGVVSGSSQLTASLDSRYLNVSGEGIISGSFTGSFVGDGSGLTGITSTLPSGILSSSVTNFTDYSQSVDTRISSIVTGTGFATTGSNTFVGNQIVTGSLTISSSNAVDLRVVGDSVLSGSLTVTGSITVPGSGSLVNFLANPNTMRSIRGNGAGLYNIVEQSDGNMIFTVTKIGTGDLTGAITSNISGSTINGSFSDNITTTSGNGRGARLRGVISGGTVVSLQIDTSNSSLGYEEYGQPANRQGVGYKAGDTVTIAQSLNQASGTLTITLRQQDIDTYFGVDPRVSINYKQFGTFTAQSSIITSGSISVGAGVNTLGSINSIAVGTDVNVPSNYSIAVGRDLYNDDNTAYANATFGMHHSSSNYAQTIVGIASRLDDTGEGAFVVGNGTTSFGDEPDTRSNLLVAQGNKVEISGSLNMSGSIIPAVGVGESTSSFSLGSPTAAWKDIWVSQGTIHFIDNAGNSQGTLSTTADGIRTDGDIFISSSVRVGRGAGNNTLNTIVGMGSLGSNTTGTSNTAVGASALNSNTTGYSNTAMGGGALAFNGVGYLNTAFGQGALYTNQSGSANTAVGVRALNGNIHSSANTALGYETLLNASAGFGNTALGYQAGYHVSGSSNNNVYLGYQAGPTGSVEENFKLYIDFQQNNNPLIGGDFQQREVVINGALDVTTLLTLSPRNPLPAGTLGSMAVSGSSLYFHNGSQWREVSLV